MQLIQISRKLKMYRQIYAFNYKIATLAHHSWLTETVDSDSEHGLVYQSLKIQKELAYSGVYTNCEDIWLRFVCYNFNIAAKIIDQVFLCLILCDKAVSLDGAKMKELNQHFNRQQINQAFSNMPQQLQVAQFDFAWFKRPQWRHESRFLILSQLLSAAPKAISSRVAAFSPREVYQTRHSIATEPIFSVAAPELEKITLQFIKLYLPGILIINQQEILDE